MVMESLWLHGKVFDFLRHGKVLAHYKLKLALLPISNLGLDGVGVD